MISVTRDSISSAVRNSNRQNSVEGRRELRNKTSISRQSISMCMLIDQKSVGLSMCVSSRRHWEGVFVIISLLPGGEILINNPPLMTTTKVHQRPTITGSRILIIWLINFHARPQGVGGTVSGFYGGNYGYFELRQLTPFRFLSIRFEFNCRSTKGCNENRIELRCGCDRRRQMTRW